MPNISVKDDRKRCFARKMRCEKDNTKETNVKETARRKGGFEKKATGRFVPWREILERG